MLNPITEKLGKLFSKGSRGKRSKLRTEADTPLKPFSRSFLPADKENDPNASNRLNQSSLTAWKSVSMRGEMRGEGGMRGEVREMRS